VQCGYSPPFEYASFEDEEEEDEELESWEEDAPDVASRPDADELALRAMLAERGLNGSWNCAETPPKLW
jgi:hypothetical protein